MFLKRGGVYTSIESVAFGVKMKLLYECIPIAFLIETAKGTATDGEKNILDISIDGYE
jgi:fructose-1,6-bisphosphatase